MARPTSEIENPAVQVSRGLSRGRLTLVITVIALLAGAAGSAVTIYRFTVAEKQRELAEAAKFESEIPKIQNEASGLLLDARVARVIDETNSNPASHPKLADELRELEKDPLHQPQVGQLRVYEFMAYHEVARRVANPVVERRKLAAEGSAATAAAGKSIQETRVVTVGAEVQEGAVRPAIKMLNRAAQGAASGDPNVLGVPGGSLVGPQIPGRRPTSARSPVLDPYANDPPVPTSPFPKQSTIIK